MTSRPRKQVRLGAHFPGVNATTVWSDPRHGSMIDFASFEHLARTAEAAGFDFFFLAEGLRLREKHSRIHDLDVVGRPDTLPVLAALAAVTDHLGLIGTLNGTFNEPYELARQLASLDHLSDGRAGWNVVTSSDAFTGENFRRGGYLAHADRYERAREIVDLTRRLWRSWREDDVVADTATGTYLRRPDPGAFRHSGAQFDVHGLFSTPRSPQVDPVILQAGDSEAGRDVGAAVADGIFTFARPLPQAREFYRQVKDRLPAHGRTDDDLLILPGATFALGGTEAEAHANAAEVRRQQVSGPTAIQFLEAVWNRDLSGYDPDGPLPDLDPDPGPATVVQGQARHVRDPFETVREWRGRAAAEGLSIRDLVIELSARQTFIGTPEQVADQIDERVQTGAADGFILVPHLSPGGLDEFAATVVPHLQERGSFRTGYSGRTLRENLGLGPARVLDDAPPGLPPGTDLPPVPRRAPHDLTAGAAR